MTTIRTKTFKVATVLWIVLLFSPALPAQDWMTPLELQQFRDLESNDKKITFFMKLAQTRMETARLRLEGKSSKPKDPLEFFSLTDLTNSCFQALRAAMMNVQDQVEYRRIRGPELVTGLKALQKGAKSMQPFFKNMEKAGQEKKEETLYKIALEGQEFCESALRGVEKALKKYDTGDAYFPSPR